VILPLYEIEPDLVKIWGAVKKVNRTFDALPDKKEHLEIIPLELHRPPNYTLRWKAVDVKLHQNVEHMVADLVALETGRNVSFGARDVPAIDLKVDTVRESLGHLSCSSLCPALSCLCCLSLVSRAAVAPLVGLEPKRQRHLLKSILIYYIIFFYYIVYT